MNNKIKYFFLLISDNQAIIIDTNLKCFYEKVMEQDIGMTISLSTLRNRFIENNSFGFPSLSGRTYYFQKVINQNNNSNQIIQSKY
jgi:hypothetical protein